MSKKLSRLKLGIVPGVALTLAISYAFIFRAPAAVGGDLSKANYASKVSKPIKTVSRKIGSDAPPEAGVKLLMGILKRIGNAPQIAKQQAQQGRSQVAQIPMQSNQIFNQNVTDPALAIRPRVYKYKPKRTKSKVSRVSGKQIASSKLPPTSLGRFVQTKGNSSNTVYGDEGISRGDHFRSSAKQSYGSRSRMKKTHRGVQVATSEEAGYANERDKGISKEAQMRLKNSANKLYNITSLISSLDRNSSANQRYISGQKVSTKANRKIVKASSRSAPQGMVIAHTPRIVDYSKGLGTASTTRSRMEQKRESAAPILQGATNGNIAADAGYNTGAVAEKKLDQPTVFKHFREYTNNKLPQNEPADLEADDAASSRDSRLYSRFGRRPELSHLAYMPPNLISGVPGLRLGASKKSVEAFMSKHGIIHKSQVNGWEVWVLKNRSNSRTSLQAYMRNGTVEAFRVFDSKFVPARLKINLSTPLEKMKEKFGEPAFILNEPSTGAHSVRGIKNYVYPVSQVSFQLTRSPYSKGNSKKRSIRISSLLLFKFL